MSLTPDAPLFRVDPKKGAEENNQTVKKTGQKVFIGSSKKGPQRWEIVSELVALGRRIEELERPKAKERQREAGRAYGRGIDSSGSAEPKLSARTIGVTDMTVGRDLSTATNVAVDEDMKASTGGNPPVGRKSLGKDGRERRHPKPSAPQHDDDIVDAEVVDAPTCVKPLSAVLRDFHDCPRVIAWGGIATRCTR